jgi:hypothetical protein
MTDPIRAALDAACRAECMARARFNECQDEPCGQICGWCKKGTTAAIAAFLRALPDQYTQGGAAFWDAIPRQEETRLWLADAVLAAAKDQAND